MSVISILMVGVGGQGIVLSSNILCDAALADNHDVKKSEIHGMAQRGGSVVSHVRFGRKVLSPSIPLGEADYILSLESMEHLRYLDYIGKGSTLIANEHTILPPSVASGEKRYPTGDIEESKKLFSRCISIPATKIAGDMGNRKAVGSVMLGALAACLDIDKKCWQCAIERGVPSKLLEVNLGAFGAGFTHVQNS